MFHRKIFICTAVLNLCYLLIPFNDYKSQNVMYLDKTLLSIDFENVLAFKGEREGLQSFGVVAAGREG